MICPRIQIKDVASKEGWSDRKSTSSKTVRTTSLYPASRRIPYNNSCRHKWWSRWTLISTKASNKPSQLQVPIPSKTSYNLRCSSKAKPLSKQKFWQAGTTPTASPSPINLIWITNTRPKRLISCLRASTHVPKVPITNNLPFSSQYLFWAWTNWTLNAIIR